MISVRSTGQAGLVQRLKQIRRNFSTIVRDAKLDEWMVRRTLDRFDKEISPDGVKWPAAAASTVKRKKGMPDKLLVRTGTLRRAIGIIRGSREGLFAVNTGLGMRVGVTDPDVSIYGRVHNQGLMSGSGRMKRRRFLGISKNDVVSLKRLLRDRARVILGE